MSWREAWQERNTPWDAGSAVPDLVMNLLAGKFEKIELREARRSHEGREGKEWVGRWILRPTT